MKFLAMTHPVAEWLLPKLGAISFMYEALQQINTSITKIDDTVFAQNSIRISYDRTTEVCALWHADYVSGTGDENWGFIKWSGELAITEYENIAKEVFERCCYVITQRLQGLLLDGSVIHRAYSNGGHTLLAGRGTIAHQLSIGYFETLHGSENLQTRSIILVGPGEIFNKLTDEALLISKKMGRLCASANSLINHQKNSKGLLPFAVFPRLRACISEFFHTGEPSSREYDNFEFDSNTKITNKESSKYLSLTYEEWIANDSPLSEAQRRILFSESIDKHPLRILGPGGSGKTLLMQLLTLRKLELRNQIGKPCRILYIVHSKAMAAKAFERFNLLTSGCLTSDGNYKQSTVQITTLADYCREELGVELQSVLDVDAEVAKNFQQTEIESALRQVGHRDPNLIERSHILKQIFSSEKLLLLFANLISVEISVAIKGHGLELDKKRYIESEKNLSLLHGNLNQIERGFVFEVFKEYHRVIFEGFEVLDPDDIAISLAGRLRTPVWQLRRQSYGFDYVFVDEAQLFNENEKRLFPLLVKNEIPHVPIALALDQAQATYGQSTAGLSTIGIKGITSETLLSIHRSTDAIIRLAFFVIQRSTELFSPDFPDFTSATNNLIPNDHILAAHPCIEKQNPESKTISKFILKRVRELRKANTRQIAIICYSDIYWQDLEATLSDADLPFQVIRERGAKFPHDQPLVSLVKPAQVGGQEFDAVILVGLEAGLIPPVILDNQALANAVEQQTIRDIYLGITRARYRVVFVVSKAGMPTKIIEQAVSAKLVTA